LLPECAIFILNFGESAGADIPQPVERILDLVQLRGGFLRQREPATAVEQRQQLPVFFFLLPAETDQLVQSFLQFFDGMVICQDG
jgi:hypothetical protein